MTDTQITPQTTDPDLQEENRYTHIVGPLYTDEGKIQGTTRVTEAMINGTAVEAVCGYLWVPSRNPENFPICQACKSIVERSS